MPGQNDTQTGSGANNASGASGGNSNADANNNANNANSNNTQNNGGTGGSSSQAANQNANGSGNGDNSRRNAGNGVQPRTLRNLENGWRTEFMTNELPGLIDQKIAEREAANKAANGDPAELKQSLATLRQQHTDLNTRYTTLAQLIDDSIDAQTQDWPESVTKFDPATKKGKGKYTVEERMEWLLDHKDLAQQLAGNAVQDQQSGNGQVPPVTPPAQGQNNAQPNWEEWKKGTAQSTAAQGFVRF